MKRKAGDLFDNFVKINCVDDHEDNHIKQN